MLPTKMEIPLGDFLAVKSVTVKLEDGRTVALMPGDTLRLGYTLYLNGERDALIPAPPFVPPPKRRDRRVLVC